MSDLKFLKKIIREAIAREKYGLLTENPAEIEKRKKEAEKASKEAEQFMEQMVVAMNELVHPENGILEKMKQEIGSYAEPGQPTDMFRMASEEFLKATERQLKKVADLRDKWMDAQKRSAPDYTGIYSAPSEEEFANIPTRGVSKPEPDAATVVGRKK